MMTIVLRIYNSLSIVRKLKFLLSCRVCPKKFSTFYGLWITCNDETVVYLGHLLRLLPAHNQQSGIPIISAALFFSPTKNFSFEHLT